MLSIAPIDAMGAFIFSLWLCHKEVNNMAKIINCVIDTKSRDERLELINYLAFDNAIFSMVDRNYEGFQLIAVFPCGVGCVGVIVAKDLVNNKDFKHLSSVSEFIKHCEAN
jgi:hypothetical protein